MTRPRNILCALCLLVAGTGCLSAGSPKKADKYGVRESASAELLAKKRLADGKVTFRCRIVRRDGEYTLLAKVQKNDSAVHIVRPGVRFVLAGGDSVVLKAERPSACCSGWADGRWYNVSFKLGTADAAKLKGADVLSVTLPFHGGEAVRKTAPGKEGALAGLLQSLDD